MTNNNKIIVYDRYSDKVFECHKNTVFIVGKNIAKIRKSNNECVDLLKNDGTISDWWCLEYVLKNPQIFKPLVICKDVGNVKTNLKTIRKPLEFNFVAHQK